MTLPTHGKINCHKCYRSSSDIVCQPHHLWNMRNDPGAWGGSNPEILVLGFSKGSTQANIYQNGRYEDVAFGGAARGRLDEALKRLNLLSENEHVTEHIENPDSRFAFGSLVRCSLSREGADGKHATSGQLIVKSFKEIPDVLDSCARKFLANLPDCTKIILMLGVSDAYIDGCYNLLATIYPGLRKINDVAYGDDERLFVHITHPSPGNGHFSSWNTGNSKFELALSALNQTIAGSLVYMPIDEKVSSAESASLILETQYIVETTNSSDSTESRTRKNRIPVSTVRTFCVPFNHRQNGKDGYKVGENPVKENGVFVQSFEEALEKLRKMNCAGWRAYGKGPGSNGGARKSIAWVTVEDANKLLDEPDNDRRIQIFKSLSDVVK